MTQKTIMEYGASAFQQEIDTAIRMGWKVQSVAVNSETNYWFAVLTK